ncbi:MAG TPA: hypothetical protein VFL83_00785 [Anaeromyxobacter sp.]|nr:hypothetical protein [Anaeromyxobacter sp.]
MNDRLARLGACCFAAFPAVLVLAFALHFAGEFTPAQALELELRYVQPPPERFMEVFRSGSALDFVLPHLLVYLALPLLVPGVLAFAAPLFRARPRLAVAGAATSLAGLVFMGGVFGSWLSFSAIGRVGADQVEGAVPALAALIRGSSMLTLTSLLGGLSLLGIVVLAAGLLRTRAVPRWQPALVLAGNAVILAFMDLDNLMLVGAALWLAGAIGMARAPGRSLAAADASAPAA